ncbi:plasmid mobilization relaxosome protein MobC [Helicobacter sp. MIT 11-5569]|uniref:ATPase, T2SS/T4P/T4SS family n=1 Tax=Helicobacter sp. MIT 11-5569 TaxID=1548151 RepID=UPI000AB841B9|nr:ATPase, T2SS/T4P/T4SS family [Helicobacter sp. MIT 11-5569]TLD85189.1 plasmid mobilization relaxosome protein MobC [Helicobacter sp. MIT 11-5569]
MQEENANLRAIDQSQEISAILKSILRHFDKYLSLDANELIINREKEVLIDRQGEWEIIADETLSLTILESFLKELATKRKAFNASNPSLSCELPYPYLRYRVQAQHQSVLFNSNIGISIRIPSKARFELNAFTLSDLCLEKGWTYEKIKDLVKAHKSILISGGTGTGKTSFLNALANEIYENERIVTIEDSQELSLKNHNILQLAVPKVETNTYSYRMAIDNALRLRPDRLLLGEIDMRNTLPFLRASNTGHDGNLSTLHANSPKDAIKAIAINVTLGGGLQNPDSKMMNSYIESGVDYIIQIKRVGKQRVITDILNLKETDLILYCRRKEMRLNLYLNPQEYKILSRLKTQTGYTKNAIIRKMIQTESIKNNNEKLIYFIELNRTFIDNIHKIGNNINQIAHRLNISSEQINPNDLQNIYSQMNEVKKILEEYKEIYKENKLDSLSIEKSYRKNKESQND